jgi:hypothetical protein
MPKTLLEVFSKGESMPKKKVIRMAGDRWIVNEKQEDGSWFTILSTDNYQRAVTKLVN